jgi:transposase InsO family protein
MRETLRREEGNCWDNACAETFFKTLKRELETLDGAGNHVVYLDL